MERSDVGRVGGQPMTLRNPSAEMILLELIERAN